MYSNLATVPASMPAENSFELLTQFHGNAQAEREMNGFPMSFDRIKIPSAGGTIFEVPSLDGAKATPAQEITGVVLYHHPMQSYYKQQYTGGNEKPDCYSMDKVTGIGVPGGECATCMLNKFKTGANGGKACKEKHRIYLLRENEIFPIMLDLPTGSVREFGVYIRRLISRGLYSTDVLTSFSLKKAFNSTGTPYSQVVCSFVRMLTPEEKTAIKPLAEQVSVYAESRNYELEPDDDVPVGAIEAEQPEIDNVPFDFDPATGEVIGDSF